MSYVVIARKWRPATFEDVVSQDHISTTLKNAIQQKRIASAYLFSGPRGVGKTTTARIFAKAINCDNGPTPEPCNTCSSCTEIAQSRSLDVFEIDGASNRGIDEVRNLRENLKYSATKGKHKIYIIDEVHMLTTEAFNALLKTLEEPPPNVLFIFATTEFHKVPATILSRCQRYDFRRIPPNEIVAQLRKICEKDKVKIDDESLYLLAKKADGSMRDSQSLLDQVISFCGNDIKAGDLADLLGIIDQESYFKASDIITGKDVAAGLQLVEDIFNQGSDMSEFLGGLAEHFRNILVVGATGSPNLLEGLESYCERYQKSASDFSQTDLLRLIQVASETAYQLKRSANPKLMLEMALVKMVRMDKSVEISTLISNLNNLGGLQTGSGGQPESLPGKGQNPQQPVRTAPVEPSPLAAVPNLVVPLISPLKAESNGIPAAIQIQQIKPVFHEQKASYKSQPNGHAGPARLPRDESGAASLERIKAGWPQIVDEVKNRKIHLGSFLNEGFPTALQEEVLEISFSKVNGFHMKTVEQNKALIQEIIHEQTGFSLRLKCRKNDSEEFDAMISEVRPDASRPGQPASNDDVLQIPMVKRVLEVFDGEFVQRK